MWEKLHCRNRDEMRVYKQQIRDYSARNTPCSGHFDVCGRGRFQILQSTRGKETLATCKRTIFHLRF